MMQSNSTANALGSADNSVSGSTKRDGLSVIPTLSINQITPDPAEAIQRVLEKINEIAVLPQVVFKIVEMAGSEDSSALEMEKAIMTDPGFSARVLAQANSAFYSLPRKVSSIREAVMFLGARNLRTLAMSVGVYDLFLGKTDSESMRRRNWWRHSLDSAVCCKWLSERIPGVTSDEAYTCGLLHYIGKTILDRSAPELFPKVQELIDAGLADIDAETHIYGCSHVQITVGVVQRWKLPDTLCGPLNYVEPPSPGEAGAARACVAISDVIAKLAVTGCDLDPAMAMPRWALQTAAIDENSVSELVAQGAAKISAAGGQGF